MTASIYRQGDLLFMTLPTLPEGLTIRANNVIAEGEATGHTHRLQDGRVLEDAQGALFLEAFHATHIIHQEHHTINLPAGCYRVIRQREYTPEGIREIYD